MPQQKRSGDINPARMVGFEVRENFGNALAFFDVEPISRSPSLWTTTYLSLSNWSSIWTVFRPTNSSPQCPHVNPADKTFSIACVLSSRIKPQEVVHDHKAVSNFGYFATFKAGFLLPAEIRAATIQMEEEPFMAVPASLNQTTRNSTEQGPSSRRTVTGPV